MAWRRLPRAEIRCPTGSIPILHLDRHVVVVNKPGGCPSQGDKSLAPDVLTLTQATLQSILNKPKVFLGLVHRLDRNTSGAQLMCLTSKAARRLSEQLRERTTVKVYLTVATGSVKQRALWRDTVVTGLSGNVTRVTKGGSEGQEAVMEVLPLAEAMHQHGGPQTLLAVRLVTGRKHQIRAQLSSRGHPIVGDVKYGSASAFRDRSLALHCWRFGWKQPIGGEQMWVEAPWPESWEARFKGLLDKSPLRLRRKGDGQLGPWEELLA